MMSDSDYIVRSYEADVESDWESESESQCCEAEEEASNGGNGVGSVSEEERKEAKKLLRKKSQVLLEGYVGAVDDGDHVVLKRTKSLTDDDLEELKGCLDLGFGFSYEEIPELCNTLPALELCYSMSQKFLDHDHHKSPERTAPVHESPVSPIASWKISSPGDNPDDVKARLKFWAQTVACTVKLCS